ncbi:MAG: ribosome maturation factor RimP [Lactobacillus sp.]|nr:ribosome maturation factor RimP [Lactobacillus sp.]MCH3906165.1 ribosome maturation factor RimP [Lactobacillus sp.]MCH3990258.1 ribosome maturation factor RimP [Lactobacillus sp.]MCH4069028.1 ribosome maturation factor RimP [Lactobacillus sp.]MCI1303430.1 ribosome maturation factor RimP [Lactobacillus sp.]
MSKIIERVTQAVEPIITEHGCELVDAEYVKEQGQNYLRLYLNRQPGGIDLQTISDLTEPVSNLLDEIKPDPFPEPYVLEMSSPGLERPIKTERDWERAKGEYIHVGLYQKIAGSKTFEGTLLDYDDEQLTLAVKQAGQTQQIEIPRKKLAQIRFAVEL